MKRKAEKRKVSNKIKELKKKKKQNIIQNEWQEVADLDYELKKLV